KLLLQLLQLGQDMHAVDAAIGPEVEQDEFALQVGLGQRLAVQPRSACGKVIDFDALGERVATAAPVTLGGRRLSSRLAGGEAENDDGTNECGEQTLGVQPAERCRERGA